MNTGFYIGRLTRDPEIRYTQAGKAVASFNIAVDSGYGDNKRTDFLNIVAWDKLGEMVGNNLTKGRKILVEGRLQIDSFEKDGVKRREAKIIAKNIEFLDKKEENKEDKKENYDVSSLGTEVFPQEIEF